MSRPIIVGSDLVTINVNFDYTNDPPPKEPPMVSV